MAINCPDEVQETVCRYENENCIGVAEWSEWSEWSTCSPFCGDGTKERTRNCRASYSTKEEIISNRIASAEMVMECLGKAKEIVSCTLRYNCRVDGQWSEWSKWDICDAPSCSSEVGQQTRYRRCTNPRPMFGGKKCHGSSIGTKSCYNNEYCSDPVDGQWCSWMPWSRCENRVQKRSRQCRCPNPVNSGRECDGNSMATQNLDNSLHNFVHLRWTRRITSMWLNMQSSKLDKITFKIILANNQQYVLSLFNIVHQLRASNSS